MNILLSTEKSIEAKALIIPFFEDLKLKGDVCGRKREEIEKHIELGQFKGKKLEVYPITRICEKRGINYVILVGLGKEYCEKTIFESIAKAVQKVQELKVENVIVHLDNIDEALTENGLSRAIIGAGLGEYKFENFKSKDKTTDIKEIEFVTSFANGQKVLEEAKIILDSIIEARNLVNLPANIIKPESLANRAKELGEECGFEVEIFEEDKIREFGMDAYLAVAQGSDARPRLIVMRYKGAEGKENFGIVGKGLTYDSGGYSIKPSESMSTMKTDMGGSAAVIGAMCAISKAKLPVNVTAVVAACENMLSGHSILPGDIVKSMCGKFIEIEDTDAEGRLTLIDAVHYAIKKENCSKVLDIATLTGGVVRALGDLYAGVLGNNCQLMTQLKEAAKISGDAVWEMPYDEDVIERNKSKIADITNIGTGSGLSCSIGGAFVGEGIIDNIPWVHVDIAGVSDYSKDRPYCRQGATGFGVNLIYQLVKNS